MCRAREFGNIRNDLGRGRRPLVEGLREYSWSFRIETSSTGFGQTYDMLKLHEVL